MSIAVSAVIRPSRGLRLALAGFGALHLLALVLLAWRPDFAAFPALVCGAAAALCLRRAARFEMTRRIDISGVGEIGLTVQQSLGAPCAAPVRMRLLPGSTLWPVCLFLRLQPDGGGRVLILAILPVSMASPQRRQLAVAIRTIAGRDNKFFAKHKIL